MGLALAFLGGFQATVNGHPATFATDRARALLAYLAVEADQPHRREALATLLWPDDLPSAARQNLSQTVLRVRQAIGDYASDNGEPDSRFFQITRQTLQLKRTAQGTGIVNPVTVDVRQFQRLLAAGAGHDHADLIQCTVCCARLAEAVELYHGPFLEGIQLANSAPFEEWVLFTREQVQRQVLEALDTLARHYAAAGNQAQVQQIAARQLAIEPWREAAHRQLMTALALAGQRGAALAQYESCRHLLTDELGVAPEAETTALYEQIRAGKFDKVASDGTPRPLHDHPFTPSSPRDPYTLLARLEPLPDQQLFGVAAAQTRLYALLQAGSAPWIIAIDGLGGIGKTTLASRLAHEFVHSDRFADLAWVSAKQAEFQPATGIRATGRSALDADGLTDALLGQLLPDLALTVPRPEKRAALLRHLKTHPCLIIIDNLETIIDTAALLPEVRHLANPSKFLITTRYSLAAEAGVFAYTLTELSESDVLAFVRYEAATRNIAPLLAATPAQLTAIYRVVGCNSVSPMASPKAAH